MRILEYIMKKKIPSNDINKLEKELDDILNLNKVLTHIEEKKFITPPIKQHILPRYQQPKYNQQNLRYQPRHHPQPQQYYQYYHPQYPQYQYYHPRYPLYQYYYHPQYNQQYQQYHPQYQQYPLYQQKNKIPTINEMCIEKGYVKGPKKPIINKRTSKIPTVDEICIEKGYLKPSVKKKYTDSSGELFGGSNSHHPKKTRKNKPKKPKVA